MSVKPSVGRPKLADKIEEATGVPFYDLLAKYTEERWSPEQIAAEHRCSVVALLENASDHGYELVRTLRRRSPSSP